jgi:mono/diheme cytochrome c family protein
VRLIVAFAVALMATDAAAAQAKAPPPDLEHGRQVFQTWCAACHAAGPGHPGSDALQVKYHGEKPAVLEERRDLTPEQVRIFVRKGVSVMPFFRKTEISDADLDALGAWIARKKR